MESIRTPYGGRLEFYPACDQARNETVLICPGGGYSFLSEREGRPVAEAFNKNGYAAVVFYYNLDQEVHGTRLVEELAWSVRRLRTLPEWRGHARKIWVAGFSAGGHLAASLGVHWNNDELFSKEEQASSRPDGLILGYPVISMGAYSHERSRKRLTGEQSDLIRLFSLENQDLSQIPPVFLWNTLEDEKVSVMNSLLFAQKIALDGASCEYHLFHKGRHGMSLATAEVESAEEDLYPNVHIAHWLELCLEWLKEQEKESE